MNRFHRNLRSEFLKLFSSKVFRRVLVLVTLVQGGLAYIAMRQILSVGLTAGPETNRNLYEAIPPLEYLGFDLIVFGLLPMIILGAIYGSQEYQNHGLRSSLLFTGSKKLLFCSKLTACFFSSLILSLVSIYMSILITHLALGSDGLGPLLGGTVWKHIFLASLSWTFLTLLSFLMGSFFRTALVPLLFLIPQVYNIGDFLGTYFLAARFLPVYLANGLIAASPKALSPRPMDPLFFMMLWLVGSGGLAFLRFIRTDLGGRY